MSHENYYESENEYDDFFDPEQEIKIIPSDKIILPNIVISNGEENEDLIFINHAKLFRWRSDEWKERGMGKIKLLRNKINKKIRCILRQDKTLKVMLNINIGDDPLCILKEYDGSEKKYFFTAYDFSDQNPIVDKFVLKFSNLEIAETFKKDFNDAKALNKKINECKDAVLGQDVIENDELEVKKEEKKNTEENSRNQTKE